jgi:hypothetical protein
MTVESFCFMSDSRSRNLRIRQLTVETCYLLSGSSSVSLRMIELVRCLAENNKSSVSIAQVSGNHLILRVSGCCKRAKRSGNILIFRNKDQFTTIKFFNFGNKVECLVSLLSQEKRCSSRLEYYGEITDSQAIGAFKGLLSLAQELAPAKSKKPSYREVSCG